MTKKGPLGKAEKYYVEGHYNTMEAKDIAKELDRPVNSINKHIEKVKAREPELHTAGGQMARQDGITIMTENASNMSDEMRGKGKSITRADLKRKSCTTGTDSSKLSLVSNPTSNCLNPRNIGTDINIVTTITFCGTFTSDPIHEDTGPTSFFPDFSKGSFFGGMIIINAGNAVILNR